MGPWDLGRWFRPLALLNVLACGLLLVVGVQPPNEKALWTVAGAVLLLALVWYGYERGRFPGPPRLDVAGGLGTALPVRPSDPVGQRTAGTADGNGPTRPALVVAPHDQGPDGRLHPAHVPKAPASRCRTV
jgi:hypothetical protein